MFLPVISIRHSSNFRLYWSSNKWDIRQLVLHRCSSTVQQRNQHRTAKCYTDNRITLVATARRRIQQQRRELSFIAEQHGKSLSFTYHNSDSFYGQQFSTVSSNDNNSSSTNQQYSSNTKLNNYKNKKTKNAYELFSIPPQFIIDEEQLKLKYHELMKQLHPDKQQPAVSNDTDTNEEEMAATITDAYNTLKRPHLRAIQLLRVMMTTTSESNNKDASDTTTDNDDDQFMKQFENAVTNAFLLHIMEIQEEIADLHHEKHHSAIQQHYTNNQQQMEDCYQQLQKAYMNHNIQQFVAYTVQLKYYTRIDETLRNKMS